MYCSQEYIFGFALDEQDSASWAWIAIEATTSKDVYAYRIAGKSVRCGLVFATSFTGPALNIVAPCAHNKNNFVPHIYNQFHKIKENM